MGKRLARLLVATSLLAGLVFVPTMANADDLDEFVTPIFGLNNGPNRTLLVADAGAGIWQVRGSQMDLAVELPGAIDVEMIRADDWWAIGSPSVYRITKGVPTQVADLYAYEAKFNPDGGEIDSNPFDLASLGSKATLVADAGGNSLLQVQKGGKVSLVATFPQQLASTDNAMSLAGCPNPPEEFAFVCDLPDQIPADTVPTSVAVGPDGAYYVGELIGFPAPTGESKVWRIEPGTRKADCSVSPACSVVATGLTSIVDLAFGPDGTLYVLEIDEATWLAVELGIVTGGTVNACNTGTGACSVVAGGLPLPSSIAVNASGRVFAAILSLVPGEAQVVPVG